MIDAPDTHSTHLIAAVCREGCSLSSPAASHDISCTPIAPTNGGHERSQVAVLGRCMEGYEDDHSPPWLLGSVRAVER